MSKMFITEGEGSQQTLSDIQDDKIPVYDTAADAEADFANIADDQIYFTKDNGNNNRYVLQSEYKADNTYSTNEVNTGKTWIDGKPIYRKTFYSATNWALDENVGTIDDIDMPICIRNISANNSTSGYMTYVENYGDYYYGGGSIVTSAATIKINISTRVGTVTAARRAQYENNYPSCIIIEYTKTTD